MRLTDLYEKKYGFKFAMSAFEIQIIMNENSQVCDGLRFKFTRPANY